MCTAQAKQMQRVNRAPVVVVNRAGQPQWHEVFENNLRITRNPVRAQRLLNCSGSRPYIAAKTPTKWTWKTWKIEPGEIYLSSAEREFAARYEGRVLIEPNTKVEGSNKAWEWDRWQELVLRMGPHKFIQVGAGNGRRLRDVFFVETPTVRHGAAVLAASRAFVGTEGFLHHAAAALARPAVVLFSAFISPTVTGYEKHRNIYKGTSWLGCGTRVPCDCCRQSMLEISVDEVAHNLKEIAE